MPLLVSSPSGYTSSAFVPQRSQRYPNRDLGHPLYLVISKPLHLISYFNQSLCWGWIIDSCTEHIGCRCTIVGISVQLSVHVDPEVTLYGIWDIIKYVCCATIPFWMHHIEKFHFHWIQLNRLLMVFPVQFYLFRILHAELSLLVDGIVVHLSLFLPHLAYSCTLSLYCRVWLSLRLSFVQIVTQTIS